MCVSRNKFPCYFRKCHNSHYFYRPVYGLIFLFKWLPGDHNNQGSLVMDSRRTEIFFAKQARIFAAMVTTLSCGIM